jgi:hypothetical protein
MRNSRLPSLFLSPLLRSALLVLAIAAPAAAQTGGGSSYSIFNIGDLRTSSTAAAAGRGGVEASAPSSTSINSLNPAAWSDVRLVILQATMNFEQYQVSDPTGKISQNSSRLQDFSVAFPYSDKFGGTIALGVRPYSTVNYSTAQERSVQTADSVTKARVAYSGHGGLSEAILGTSFRPVDWMTLGVAGSAYFGSITSNSAVTFPSVSDLNPANYRTSDQFVGWGVRGGLHIDPTEDLRIGAVFESGSNLTRQHIASSQYAEADTILTDTSTNVEGTFKLPARVTVGGSYMMGRSMIAAEGSMQSWGTEQFATARPSSRVAVGYEYLPSPSVNASGFERWTFRLGGYHENTYYQLENGTGINQMGVTLGARYPLGGSNATGAGTAFDVALELGQRGTTDNNLTKEMFGKLSVEIAVSELWFVRSKR